MKRLACALLLAAVSRLAIEAATPLFTDITASAGIRFTHNNGASGKKYYPETMGSGVVVFDADGDNAQDLLFVNGTRFPGEPGPPGYPALYRNRGNLAFDDVTKGSGLDVEMYGMGGAAADYDNDGRVDLFVTAWGGGRLFRNLGGGKFGDVTTRAGITDRAWSSGAMWFDYDRDGALDLLVVRYLSWEPRFNQECSITGKDQSFCPPVFYRGIGPLLYRNRGDGTFADVSAAAGLSDTGAKGLGVVMFDFDADGWLDIFVAADTTQNLLFRNNRNGTFTDVGLQGGVAVTARGTARAGMGTDAADYDGSGRPGIIVGNFAEEMLALYRNDGRGLFVDEAPGSSIGRDSRWSLTFGLFFFDADMDGRLDIFAANGHISDIFPPGSSPSITHAQRPHLFRNLGSRRFEETIGAAGPELARRIVGRGAAYGDFDLDGDLDLVVTENRGPARLYRNDLAGARSLRVKLERPATNRDAIGARVDLTRADGSIAWALVKTGSSYLSQSELPLTFGLGPAAEARSLKITWPDGRSESIVGVKAGEQITIRQGNGIVARTPLTARK